MPGEKGPEGINPFNRKDSFWDELEAGHEMLELDEESRAEIDDFIEQLKEHYMSLDNNERMKYITKLTVSLQDESIYGSTKVVLKSFLKWVEKQNTN